MNDKRSVGELSVEELERILAIRKREERMTRYRRQDDGRTLPMPPPDQQGVPSLTSPQNRQLMQHERASAVPAPVEPLTYDLTEEVPHFEGDQLPVPVTKEPTFIDDVAPQFGENHRKPKTIDHRNRDKGAKSTQQKILSWALLLVEIGFVAGLAIVLYRAFTGLENIQDNTNRTQQELNAAIEQGRIQPSPTPILSAANYIIPGGHTPPDENGFSVFNLNELESFVPENVRPAVRREMLAPPAVELQTLPNDPVSIDIPAIGINNATIVTGDHWDALKAGIGHRPDSGRPGTGRNVVLTGHNDIYGEIFRYLTDLENGDEIRIRDASGRIYTYRVTRSFNVQPTDTWVLDPNLGNQVTLITCYPYKVDNERWIVFADLIQ